MTIDEGIALIAVHLGIVDEEAILNMSWVFFEDVLLQLGKKLNYDAVVNYAGNAFAKNSWKMIMESNPMTPEKKGGGIADFFARADVRIEKKPRGQINKRRR